VVFRAGDFRISNTMSQIEHPNKAAENLAGNARVIHSEKE
jgi:hypothetical protein